MSIMEKYIDTDEVRVYYDVYRKDRPKTVVLIHGFGLDRRMWEPQLSILDEYHVICLDARGHGKSRPCDDFTIPKVCEDILQILRAEACDTAAIVGLSMGSYVAQEFARLYPEKTAGVFVADGTPIFIRYANWEKNSLRLSSPLLQLYPWKTLKKLMAKQTSVKGSVREKLVQMFDGLTKKEFISSWAGVANALHEEEVEFSDPFYVVYGDSDKSGTIKMHAKDWKKTYSNCVVHEIPNAGHVSNMDHPEAFNAILLEFLSLIK